MLSVEPDVVAAGCPGCGVLAQARGRQVHELADAPAFGLPVRLRCSKRLWRCAEPGCPVISFSEQYPFAPARARLTARAVSWAAGMLRTDDTTVSALARRLGVGWNTLWRAIQQQALAVLDRADLLSGVTSLGADENI